MRRFLMIMGCLFAVLVVVALVGGIIAFYFGHKAGQQAEVFVADFYERAERGQWEEIYDDMIHSELQKEMEKERFIHLFSGLYEKLGRMTEKKREDFSFRIDGDGTAVDVSYAVQRVKAKSTEFFKLKKTGEDWKIRTFVINSEALLE